jgi:hypothetical protein
MKTTLYKGWKIYKTSGGSNNRLQNLNAKHPLRVAKLSCVIDSSRGLTPSIATAHIKRDIDAIESAS